MTTPNLLSKKQCKQNKKIKAIEEYNIRVAKSNKKIITRYMSGNVVELNETIDIIYDTLIDLYNKIQSKTMKVNICLMYSKLKKIK